MYLGWKKENPALKQGIANLCEIGPSKKDVVYNFFAQNAVYRWKGHPWRKWNATLRDRLVGAQSTEGKEAGSWFDPGDLNAAGGGRLFQTAINLMTLEVYYTTSPGRRRPNAEDAFPE